MPYSELKPGRLRLEDETTGNARLLIQTGDHLEYTDGAETRIHRVDNIEVGLKAGQPAAGVKYRLYFCTDTQELFLDDGTNWNRLACGGASIYDTDRDTYFHVEKSADEDILRGYAGGQEVFRGYASGIFDLVKQSGCYVYTSTDQAISAATITKVQFDTVLWDTQGEFDPTTNYRFTASQDGKYLIIACLYFAVTADLDGLLTLIYKNGLQGPFTRVTASGAASISVTCAAVLTLLAGDYIEIYAENTANADTIWANKNTTYLNIVKIA